MEITQLFLEMLQYPNSPKIYREMRDMYFRSGKLQESKAFAHLLEIRYKELSNDNNTDTNQKP
jgi:hypothetical protein